MKITLYKNSKIYILAPANLATGGVELLHQLAYKINNILGFDNVFIKYIGENSGTNPTPKDYEKYNVKRIDYIDDSEENLLIIPEVYTKELNNFSNIRKVVWWLSVDNYYFSVDNYCCSKRVSLSKREYNHRIILKLFNSQNFIGFNENLKNIQYHWVQSEYARQHLIQKGIEPEYIEYLSDYLISTFFNEKWELKDKKNIVCYNPKKGFKFTKSLIRYMRQKGDNLEFVAIQNMNRSQVIDLLKSSKCYIDFGNFPGKDRIPREAAILGNIIIISKMGAGKYFDDFPLNEKWKVYNLKDLEGIRNKILESINDYNKLIKEFSGYISIIRDEENKFNKDLIQIFVMH